MEFRPSRKRLERNASEVINRRENDERHSRGKKRVYKEKIQKENVSGGGKEERTVYCRHRDDECWGLFFGEILFTDEYLKELVTSSPTANYTDKE